MHWVDVCGPPGSGKSTLCDPLWGPHELPINMNSLPPIEWHDFFNEIARLFELIDGHWSFDPAVRMNRRSARKMATVARTTLSKKEPYIQTGFIQRGLGFGWRLNEMGKDLNELRHFFRLMPVSIGVAVTKARQSTIIERNHHREKVKETSHENRDFMVPLMEKPIEIALDVLKRRVPILEIDTEQPIERSRQQLIDFASQEPFNPTASGHCVEMEALSPHSWWG